MMEKERVVVLDFETYYDKDYSLSKLTTEEYIRSPRFEVIGVSVKVDDGPIEWITGDVYDISDALNKLKLEECTVVAHNAVFDCAILAWVFCTVPKKIVDTLSMARPIIGLQKSCSLRSLAEHYHLGHKGTEIYNTLGKRRKDFTAAELAAFGEYCRQDVFLTALLYPLLLAETPPEEMELIDLTIRMFTEPFIELDEKLLKNHLKEVKEKKAKLLELVGHEGREAFMSNEKFANLLRAEGVEPPTKVSERTGKTAYAFAKTDDGMRELLNHPNERVQALAAARLGLKSTIEETRTQAFIDIAERGRMPIQLNYYGAMNTGRFCLTGDTQIIVLRSGKEARIRLDTLRDDDLVWDGTDFVEHDGLVCRGEREVITYQGITGTPDHRVFVEEEEDEDTTCSLLEASIGGYTLKTARRP